MNELSRLSDREVTDMLRRRSGRPAPDGLASSVLESLASERARHPVRTAGRSKKRPLMLLAAAALLLVGGAVAAGSGLVRLPSVVPPEPAPSLAAVQPPLEPTPSPAASLAPAVGPWTAVYARSSARSVDIITLAPDGSPHLVRSVPTSGQGAVNVAAAGLVSRTGMAFLYWRGYESSATGPIAVFDLGQPSRPPVLEQMGAPVGPRWSATGLLAVPGLNPSGCTSEGPECWAVITILDPATGGTRRIGQLGLFGGGPSIVWAADASGIWDGGRLRPADGGADVPIAPNQLFIDRRLGAGGRAAHDGELFASDGRALLTVSDEVVGGQHVAVVRRTDEQGAAVVLARWTLPDGAYGPWLDEPDPSDTAFPISYSTGPKGSPTFVEGPTLYANGTVAQVDGGFFMGWVPTSLAASWGR